MHGVVFAHYEVGERAAEAYALITLYESGYARQLQLARSFGYSARSLRRYQARFEAGGMGALARDAGRQVGARIGKRKARGRDQTILRLKGQGMSTRAIAGRLGVFENAIRKRLRRLGWLPSESLSPPRLPLEPPTTADAVSTVEVAESAQAVTGKVLTATAERAASRAAEDALEWPLASLDHDPLDRSSDRLLAQLGLLEDAAPVFAPAENLPMAGVLLVMPALLASGVLPIARRLYGSIGPAFYGLRTTRVAYLLLALLRIPRPEALKEHAPGNLGRIIGLDRMLEVKTLRRKLTVLAARRVGRDLGRELARRREVTDRPIPLDLRAVQVLRRSPLALDLYTWVTYRMSYLTRPVEIPWGILQLQFGADYPRTSQGRADFKRKMLGALKKIAVVYPKLRANDGEQGLRLLPGPTHVRGG